MRQGPSLLSRARLLLGTSLRQLAFGPFGLLPLDTMLRFRRIHYRVGDGRLEVSMDGKPQRVIPLRDIREIHLLPGGPHLTLPFADPWPWQIERWGNSFRNVRVLIVAEHGTPMYITPRRELLAELERSRIANLGNKRSP